MRKALIALILMSGVATSPMPAFAQAQPEIGRRVDKLEREMRAVQRKVFPGGGTILEPEITAPAAPQTLPGAPATTPITDLTARVDALESQLSALTAQSEQNAFRMRQIDKELERITMLETRLKALESGPAPAAASAAAGGDTEAVLGPATPAANDARAQAVAAVQRPATGDEAEDQYTYGFRLWEAKLYPEAQAALKPVAEKWPQHRRASFAQNLLGRAFLDEGKPALASVAFYDNYQKLPKGERAADSLYYLGQALTQLKKPADACKVYDELEDVYGATMAASLKSQVARGRQQAKCAA